MLAECKSAGVCRVSAIIACGKRAAAWFGALVTDMRGVRAHAVCTEPGRASKGKQGGRHGDFWRLLFSPFVWKMWG